MRGNQASRRWPLRVFRVVEDSMRPALKPGDLVLGFRGRPASVGQLRVFRDPSKSTRWLVKRVGDVYVGTGSTTFEARSDNPRAPGAVDSHDFGPITASGSYRVIWTLRAR